MDQRTTEIHPRRETGRRLLAGNPLLQSLFASAEDLVVVHDGGEILVANAATARSLGASSADALPGLKLDELFDAEGAARLRARVRVVQEEGRSPGRVTYRVRTLAGLFAELEATSFPLPFEGRTLVLTIARDVTIRAELERDLARARETDRDDASRALRRIEERMSLVFENTLDAQSLYRIAPDGTLHFEAINHRALEFLRARRPGVERSEVIGRERRDALLSCGMPPDEIEEEGRQLGEAIAVRSPLRFVQSRQADATHFDVRIIPVVERGGACEYVISVACDISARVRAERALQASETRFAQMFNGATDSMALFAVVSEGELRYVAVNPRMLEDMRRAEPSISEPEIIGEERKVVLARLGVADAALDQAAPRFEEVIASRAPVLFVQEMTVRGVPAHVEFTLTPILGEAGECTHVLLSRRDITERVLADRALRRMQRALLGAERLSHVGCWERELSAGEVPWATQHSSLWDFKPGALLRDLSAGEVQWTPEMYRLWDIEPGKLVSVDEILARTHPDDRHKMIENLERVRSGKRFEPMEQTVLLPGGARRILHVEAEVVDEGAGRVLRGFAQDVTAERVAADRIARQLKEKEVLLRELHHRVKNNLQVVATLLSLQTRRTRSREAAVILRESSARVAAMALVHEKLYGAGDLAHVDIASYAADLARSLFDSFGVDRSKVELALGGGGVALDADRAITVGLLLNEIIANSLKHAFPGDRRGRITIEVAALEDEDEIVVRDDGVGMSSLESQPHPSTLGMELLRRLSAQARAELELLPGGGTGYRLRLERNGSLS